MGDPREGLADDGTIVTGAARDRVPAGYEPLLSAIAAEVTRLPDGSVYLYGSVATGQARIGRSDVDLLTLNLPPDRAVGLSAELSAEFADLCRPVEIGAAASEELLPSNDEAYGLRVLLRHYCVHLGGPDRHSALAPYRGDARAARGFNGDIGRHLADWRLRTSRDNSAALGRRVARKTLLAAAGLVSVNTSTWTTDRARGAREHGRRRPPLAEELSTLLAWASDEQSPTRQTVRAALREGGVVAQVVEEFTDTIGLWSQTRAEPGSTPDSA